MREARQLAGTVRRGEPGRRAATDVGTRPVNLITIIQRRESSAAGKQARGTFPEAGRGRDLTGGFTPSQIFRKNFLGKI